MARLEGAPSVESAALTSFVPAGAGGFGLGRVFLAEGRPEPRRQTMLLALWNVVTPHYFSTLGIRSRSPVGRSTPGTGPTRRR